MKVPTADLGATIYQSLLHLMTHKPEDTNCAACTWGKMHRIHCMRLINDEPKYKRITYHWETVGGDALGH